MLSLVDTSEGRRDFLRLGALGLGGLTLPQLLQARASAAAAGSPVRTDRSVVFLFLHGGPPQQETFDPKMDAPSGVRSVTGEIPTNVPGLTFGSTLEKLARVADRLTVVRSFVPGNGNHDIKPVVGGATGGASVGSVYSRVAGPNDRATGLPTNVVLFPRAVDPDAQPGNMNFGRFDATGELGSAYAPFVPGAGGQLQEDMRLGVPRDRLDDRRALLEALDRLRDSEEIASADAVRRQAFDTILGGAVEAFDLAREDPKTIARYDTSSLISRDRIRRVWNNHKNYADHVSSLGRLMLLARRLCESGCPFVTVTTNFVWDMHADINNATVEEGMRYCGAPFDHAVSTFVQDIEERGLSDRILLVACGEMGRTPRVNARGGRDHWGGLGPLVLAGGGLPGGAVLGRSSRDASSPASEPLTCSGLVGSILRWMLDLGELRLEPGLPAEIVRMASAPSIAGLP